MSLSTSGLCGHGRLNTHCRLITSLGLCCCAGTIGHKLVAVLEKLQPVLNEGKPARTVPLTDEEKLLIKNYGLLTLKPVMFVANVSEDGFENNPYLDAVRQIAKEQGATVVAVSAQTEVELLEMPEEDRAMFLSDMGMEEPGLNRVIRAAYDLLGLQTFFTSGEKETRAWTIHKGDTAPKAAGVIHTDFERGFIRASVIAYSDLEAHDFDYAAVKAKGLQRTEGKEYVVKDGDVIEFLFNV